MEIRTCERCHTRMRRVVYGIPTDEDPQDDDGYTEFVGCIVPEKMLSWQCFECGASIEDDQG
jgi:hypothetical protein